MLVINTYADWKAGLAPRSSTSVLFGFRPLLYRQFYCWLIRPCYTLNEPEENCLDGN